MENETEQKHCRGQVYKIVMNPLKNLIQ